jgi:hypothetical protein
MRYWALTIIAALALLSTAAQNSTPTVTDSKPLLGAYVQTLMTECGAKLSEVHSRALGEQIVNVAESTFTLREEQEAFALLICIESKFNPKAKSPVGAVGLAQVMPRYAQEFADACGLGKLEAADLEYPAVNLKVGACQFRRLLEAHGGSIPLALAGYNSGQNSPTVKRLSGLAAGNPETDSYIAKFAVIRARMEGKKEGE